MLSQLGIAQLAPKNLKIGLKYQLMANYLSGAISALFGIACIPLYINLVGIDGYGLYAFSMVLLAWCALLDFGLTPTLVREFSKYSVGTRSASDVVSIVGAVLTLYAVLGFALSTLLWWAAPWIARTWLDTTSFASSDIEAGLRIASFMIAMRIGTTPLRGVLFGLGHQVSANLHVSLFSVVRAIAPIGALFILGADIEVFLLTHVVVAFFELASLAAMVKGSLPKISQGKLRPDLRILISTWSFSSGMSVLAVLFAMMNQLDKLILSGQLSLSDFGFYMLAATVAGALMLVAGPVANVAVPSLTRSFELKDAPTAQRLFKKYADLQVVMVLTPAFVMFVFAHPLILMWTADNGVADRVAPLLSVMALGTALHGLMQIPQAYRLARGMIRALNFSLILTVSLMALSLAILVPQFGALAGAWTWVAGNALYMFMSLWVFCDRDLRSNFVSWWLRSVLRPALLLGPLAIGFHLLSADAIKHGDVFFLAAIGGIASGFTLTVTTKNGRSMLTALVRIIRSTARNLVDRN